MPVGQIDSIAAEDRIARRFETGKFRVRAQVNFFNRINVIWVVQTFAEKYSAFRIPQISVITIASRPTERGVSRSSRTLGRDAVDAAVSTDE